MQGTTDFILCRDGHCQFVTKVGLHQAFCQIFRYFSFSQEDVKLLELDEKGKKKVEESCPSKEKVVRKEKEEPSAPSPPELTSPEIATIAVTDDTQLPLGMNVVVRVPDDPLPDILVKPKPDLKSFKVNTIYYPRGS